MVHTAAPKSALGDGSMRGLGGCSEALSVNMSIFEKNRFCSLCSLFALTKHAYSQLLRIKTMLCTQVVEDLLVIYSANFSESCSKYSKQTFVRHRIPSPLILTPSIWEWV